MADALPPRPTFLPPGFGTVGHKDFVEIVIPEQVSYHPQTVGWYLLTFALVLIAVGSAWKIACRYHKNAYRRAALAELGTYRDALQAQRASSVAQLPGLLKRCALAAFPRMQVASLSGRSWLAFLERTAPDVWSEQAKTALETLLVRSADELPKASDVMLFRAVEAWIRRHRA